MDNALKFGAGSPVELELDRDENDAVIRVIDHGDGVATAEHERIFGRFERAAPIQNFGGFGLGLWVSRHILDAHKGSIALAATEGGGATFTIRLPVRRS